MKHAESKLGESITQYLQMQYPEVIFRWDYSAGMPLTLMQGVRMKKLQGQYSKGFPDLTIFKQVERNCIRYGALFIELKAVNIYKKDGSLKKNEHYEEQAEMHKKLRKSGYYAEFACGFEEAKKIIDWYILNR